MLSTLTDIERYVAKMCAEGWRPVSVHASASKFVFERTEPGEYVCAMASTIVPSGLSLGSFDKARYAELSARLEERGATLVPQIPQGVLAVRRADQGPFEVHTDVESKIADHKARRSYGAFLAFLFFFMPMVAVSAAAMVTSGRPQLMAVVALFALVGLSIMWLMTKDDTRAIKRLERERAAQPGAGGEPGDV